MTWKETLKSYNSRFWEKRRGQLGETGEKAERLLERCAEEERLFLQYVFATMPLSDVGDYPLEDFARTVQSALRARKDFPWCASLPEPIFLLHVLYPRINNEELADCRELFRRELEPRVKKLSWEQAVLEVNRWCAEQVTYRSTDDKTSSPLAIYQRGFGRCGEESVFAVTALRSVGIAARQVYAPWWSHCDDNHAWVEVFDGEQWRYLGACEPEPELDRGWFTGAAARAVLIRARTFAQGTEKDVSFLFPDARPETLWVERGMACQAVTRRYGEARPAAVSVEDESGKPIAGAEVSFSVLNMAAFSEIARLKTGQDGRVRLELGLGSVLVSARFEGKYGEALADLRKSDGVRLVLRTPEEAPDWTELDFTAPDGLTQYPQPLSPEQKELRREWLDKAAALREGRSFDPAEAAAGLPEREKRVWETLTEKDRAEAPRTAVLRDSLPAFSREKDFPGDIFGPALLSPRIGLEPLAPWREELAGMFSPEKREAFQGAPRLLWDWIEREIREEESCPDLCGTPAGAVRLRAASREGKYILFCALCRSLGVPARLSPVHGRPEYFQDGSFCPVVSEETAAVILCAPEGREAVSQGNFALFPLENGENAAMRLGTIPPGERKKTRLSPGRYRVLTSTRMPGGNQLARYLDFALEAGESREILLAFREGRAADMLECRPLPSFALTDGAGEKRRGAALLGQARFSLLFWLEVGREPTEHILNELCEAAPSLEVFLDRGDAALYFIVDGPDAESDPALLRARAALPGACVWQGDFQDDAPLIARRMFGDPDKLPLVLLADSAGRGLYSCCGYNVGTGELLLRLLEELEKNGLPGGQPSAGLR